ncbi:MAG TPA: SRPBCC domain-containing protein [Fimbriiglobus sp.]|jgi:uncharacterized protein YndB with AHSA1/START domain
MSVPASAYSLAVEVTVAANRNKVWKALVKKTSDWWPASYFSVPTTKRFVIENKLGGLAFEDSGKKAGAVWGTVIGWLPPEKITFAFEMYPGWSGPGRSFVSVTLSDSFEGTTIVLEDHGVCPHADKAAQSLKDGWQVLFGTHFKEYLEVGKAKKVKKVKKPKKAGKQKKAKDSTTGSDAS